MLSTVHWRHCLGAALVQEEDIRLKDKDNTIV